MTIGARLACLSALFRFLIRMQLVAANPCDAIERPRTVPSQPRGLAAEDIQRLLAVLPHTPSGLRDRAIILTLALTGGRRAEVMGMTAGSIIREGSMVQYTYHGKGGKTGKRELSRPAYDAMVRALAAWNSDLSAMHPNVLSIPCRIAERGYDTGQSVIIEVQENGDLLIRRIKSEEALVRAAGLAFAQKHRGALDRLAAYEPEAAGLPAGPR